MRISFCVSILTITLISVSVLTFFYQEIWFNNSTRRMVMENDIVIVTNNSYVINEYDNTINIEGEYLDVLYKVRDLTHLGYSLVTHPLAASIRMFYSPVRSVVMKKGFSERSIEIIENSIEKYINTMGVRKPDYRNGEDYCTLDAVLLKEGIEN